MNLRMNRRGIRWTSWGRRKGESQKEDSGQTVERNDRKGLKFLYPSGLRMRQNTVFLPQPKYYGFGKSILAFLEDEE